MTATFDQLLRQANVALDPKNPAYLSKEHRTCEATARVLVAVRALIDSANSDTAKQETEKAKLARENSVLAARLADAERSKADAEKMAIAGRLEATDLPPATRDRIMLLSNGR